MASGDGKVTKAGWCGGGGNCVKINIIPLTRLYMRTCQNLQRYKKRCKSKTRSNNWICWINWTFN